MKRIILLLFVLGNMKVFSQTIYYVKPAGSDANSGTSWTKAFRTVQKALATIASGEIWVAAGTYYPDEIGFSNTNDRTATFYLKNNIALYGGFAGIETELTARDWKTHATILSGDIDQLAGYDDNSLHVVRGASVDGTAILDGFTITGGNANEGTDFPGATGGGMFNYAYASPTVVNCLFTGNRATFRGAAIYNFYYSSPAVVGCYFSDNSANEGGGAIYSQTSEASFTSCTFTRNYAHYGGAIYNLSSATHTINCLFWNNSAISGGAVYNWGYYSGASPTILNCTFSGNRASWGGVLSGKYCSPLITNCILWGNSSSIEDDGFPQSLTVSYSLVQGGFPGTGNISSDPLFVDSNNLHLQGCSPAIDAGRIAAVPSAVATDLDGNPRYVGGEVDMGAYEYQPDGVPTVIFVNGMVSGGLHDGTSWSNAFANLPDALQKASNTCKNTEIWVTSGTYYPTETSTDRTASFVLKNNVKLRGGFNATEVPGDLHIRRYQFTTLSGDIDRDGTLAGNSYHVVRSTDVNNSAVLNGFIITGGNADGDVNLDNDRGGGMYNERSYPTVIECIITGNRSIDYGGGMFNSNSDQPQLITNALFTQNTSDYAGGAIYNVASSPRILNCTIAANTAGKGGGVYSISGSYPSITNSILWGNGISIDTVLGARPQVSYSLVQGGWSGTGNLASDPQFVTSGYSLLSTSPAINAGSDAAATGLVTDLEGHPRKQGLHVDMGAYEFASTGSGDGEPSVPLTITCSGDFTVSADSGRCGATVDYFDSHPALVMGGKRPVTVTYLPASPAFLSIGVNSVTVTATDSTGDTKSCSFIVTVLDTTAPVISPVKLTTAVLNPSNHKMQEVVVRYQASDCTPVTTNLSVTSNEPVYGTGSGDTAPDWEIIDAHRVRLRAERSGNGTGRIYTITITATDSSGNTATATTTVRVPHDNARAAARAQIIGKEDLISGLKVNAIPNPASDEFTIITQSSSAQKLIIQVTDIQGRIIERRTGVLPNGTIYLGKHYRPGLYVMKIIQGDSMQTLKLIKQN